MPAFGNAILNAFYGFLCAADTDIEQADIVTGCLCLFHHTQRALPGKRCFLREGNALRNVTRLHGDCRFAALDKTAMLHGQSIDINNLTQVSALIFERTRQARLSCAIYSRYDRVSFHALSSCAVSV